MNFYLGLERLTEGMRKDQEQADESALSSGKRGMIKLITENSCVVYGEFKAREKDTDGRKSTHMDTRITAGLHRMTAVGL